MPPINTNITSNIEALTFLLLFLPLFSSFLAWTISSRYSWIITITAPLLLLGSTLIALFIFSFSWGSDLYLSTIPWFNLGGIELSAGILIDDLTIMMMMVVTFISFCIHLYSIGYMAGDPAIKRYFFMLGFFTFSMLGLVIADNLLLLFIFWELVGFSSYMLIGHWTHSTDASNASKKAFIINRIGDLGFLIAILIVWSNTGTLGIFPLSEEGITNDPWTIAASLCLLWGVIGKSAQFPLLTWLPDAMAGPTPVSALIHAATMVVAGIFLLARVHFLFPPFSLDVVAVIGVTTALLGAVSALFQYDIKKILAYSTISQLGLMVTAFGIGSKEASIIHLFTHAFFKAGLFLAAGSVIHTLHQASHNNHVEFDVQDIRNLGALKRSLPITFLVFIICGASLAGVPLLSGFLSKDLIIAYSVDWAGKAFSWKWIILLGVILVSFLTAVYIFRLIWIVFIRQHGMNSQLKTLSVEEAPVIMRIPMLLLSLCSVWFIVSVNPFHIEGWLYKDLHSSVAIPILSGGWVLLAIGIAYAYFKNPSVRSGGSAVATFIRNTFFLDQLYFLSIVKPFKAVCSLALFIDKNVIDKSLHFIAYGNVTIAHLIGWGDKIIVDGMVTGVAKLATGLGAFTRSFQAGKIQHYILWAIIGLGILVMWVIL